MCRCVSCENRIRGFESHFIYIQYIEILATPHVVQNPMGVPVKPAPPLGLFEPMILLLMTGVAGGSGVCRCFLRFFSFLRFFRSDLSSSCRFCFLCFFSWVSATKSVGMAGIGTELSLCRCFLYFLCFRTGVVFKYRYCSGNGPGCKRKPANCTFVNGSNSLPPIGGFSITLRNELLSWNL